jgi:hypothetical protein
VQPGETRAQQGGCRDSKSIFREFWVDPLFIVGDDWRIAAGIVIAFIFTATIKVAAFTLGIVPFFDPAL